MSTVKMNVEGMTCGHCVRGVTNALQGLEGVQTVVVSLENKNAVVEFDEQKVSIEKMLGTIQEEGYQASL